MVQIHYQENQINFRSSFESYEYTIKTEYITHKIENVNRKWILVIDGVTDERGVTIGAVNSDITNGKIDTLVDNLSKYIDYKYVNGFSKQILRDIKILKDSTFQI